MSNLIKYCQIKRGEIAKMNSKHTVLQEKINLLLSNCTLCELRFIYSFLLSAQNSRQDRAENDKNKQNSL